MIHTKRRFYATRCHATFEMTMAGLGFSLAWLAANGVDQWDLSRHEHVIVATGCLLAALFGIAALLFFARSLRALRRLDGDA